MQCPKISWNLEAGRYSPFIRAWVLKIPKSIHGEYGQQSTVYPKKYAHGFGVHCFVVVMQSFMMNSHEVFIHIHQGCFAGTGAIVRLPQCQWSKPDGYGKISQCITTTKHSKAKTVCIFLGIYCSKPQTKFRYINCDQQDMAIQARCFSSASLRWYNPEPAALAWLPLALEVSVEHDISNTTPIYVGVRKYNHMFGTHAGILSLYCHV